MNSTAPYQIMQRWNAVQHELLPLLDDENLVVTPKLEKLIHILDFARVEEFVEASWCGVGRPPHERSWMANAFIAKTVLNLSTTAALLERLAMDRSLRRICGFPLYRKLPSEATFSRAFDTFSQAKLAERIHESMICEHLGSHVIGHISRDGTTIEARERPARQAKTSAEPPEAEQQEPAQTARANNDTTSATTETTRPKRGRPRKDETRPAAKESPIAAQRKQTLGEQLNNIPTQCDRGSKCNAQGYHVSWNGYKLHIDTADCGVPIAAILSSASMHDSLAALPLAQISAQRVDSLYDVMDAAYCSGEIRAHSREIGHIPLIDHNPRRGSKIEFTPTEAVRYNERSVAERTNARLKDEFGGRNIWVRGATKVKSHLMFGLLVLSADQLIRLRH